MSKIILFAGGDAGGIRIGPNGVERIPPFDPPLLMQLRALNQLTLAAAKLPQKVATKLLGTVLGKLTGAVLSQVEQVAGELDADAGLVYQDADGGFTCGSTGKPPIALPWPVDPRQTVEEVLARGVLQPATMSFLELAARHKLDVFAVAKDPEAAAKRVGVELTPELAASLASLQLEPGKTGDKVDAEVVDFYRKVVADGRYIDDWTASPKIVAERLKLRVSDAAIDRLTDVRDRGVFGRQGPGPVMSPYAVAVVIAVVIVVSRSEFELPVRDISGLRKL